jgi:hypothetical protein
MLRRLADPRLTGMTSTELERLAATLAPAQVARALQRHRQQRGGRARRATGNLPSKPLLDDAASLLVTLLYQRQVVVEVLAGEARRRAAESPAARSRSLDQWPLSRPRDNAP